MSTHAANWPLSAASITVRPQATPSDQVRSSQLERVVRSDSAPWLPSLLFHLKLLENSGRNIPGIGDLRIAETTANQVRRLLAYFSEQNLPEPKLAPFSGGGLALILNIGDQELSFAAYPGHSDFVYMQTNEDDELVNDGVITLDQTREISDLITAFLFSLA
jgi:hypothetical protein